MTSQNLTSTGQLSLDLQIETEREIDGVGMGVLSNGAAFLTLRGLARMCGIDHSMVIRITGEWVETPLKPRAAKIRGKMGAAASGAGNGPVPNCKKSLCTRVIPG